MTPDRTELIAWAKTNIAICGDPQCVRCGYFDALLATLKANAEELARLTRCNYSQQIELEANEAIRAAEAGAQWQPIATAPKDGTNVLLWWPFWCKGRPTIGFFGYKGIQQWVAPEALEGDGDGPTHWQPLPTPPPTEEPS